MNTIMVELMAMLRDQNQGSSSHTLPPEHRPMVDPNPVVPPTFVSEVEHTSFSTMMYVPAVHPVSDPLLPPLAPTTVPLPPAAFLSTESAMHTLPPLNIPTQPPIYTGNKIKTEVPGLSFDPTVQNQNMHCEFHQGAPGHTLDTCWRLRDRIQEMIDARQISFNEVKQPNVHVNPLPDHGSGPGPSINMISTCAIGEEEETQESPAPFVIEYVSAEVAMASVPFIIVVPTKEPYQDSRVPWTYEGEVANAEVEMSMMGITRSGRVYQGPEPADKGKAPAIAFSAVPKAVSLPTKKITDQEAEAFMKVIKASEYKVVEQMGKSSAHISLLALLLSSEPHRNALLKVLTATQVPKDTALDRIEETVNSIFSNQISFADDELPLEGQGNLRALHIVCKREVNGKIDLLIDVGPCSFSVTFQILEIPNAFSLLLGRPWIHAAGTVPSSLHQKLKFFVEGKLIIVNGEEDYAVYKETAVPYISIGEDHNLPFHSFDTISVIWDCGEVGPSRIDRMIGKVLLKNDYVPRTGLEACAQGILRPIEMEEYRNRRGLDFRPSCHEIVQARRGKHLHRLAAHYGKLFKGILVPSLSQFFPAPPQIMGGTSDSPITESDDFSSDAVVAFLVLPTIYAVTEEASSRVHIRLVREDEELTNWTSVLLYLTIVADV
ncbi:hypothetical protein CRG98_018094 [Punica granatum]|uniref:G-patch domain-containing protein n=1 Tax=Punica granatum TaxID=22663 RepID=A0A2I0K070_PUNGR|nr:hypothetical protein CRG98_018094 [Punica granatum]